MLGANASFDLLKPHGTAGVHEKREIRLSHPSSCFKFGKQSCAFNIESDFLYMHRVCPVLSYVYYLACTVLDRLRPCKCPSNVKERRQGSQSNMSTSNDQKYTFLLLKFGTRHPIPFI